MRRLVVGDIHGCHEEFLELLDRAGLAAQDEIVSLGDLVDRGPRSPEVLEFFRTHPRAGAIQGNHERKHHRSARGECRPSLSQRITRIQFADEARYRSACEFMAGLPLFLDLPEALLVHGYFEPGVPLESQRATVLAGTMSGQARLPAGAPWYERYDGPKPIVVGHQDYRENGQPLVDRDLVYGLDTSCCKGGALTGLLLPEFRIVQVASRGNHWASVRREYGPLVALEDGRSGRSLTWAETERILARRGPSAVPEHERAEAALQARLEELLARSRAVVAALRASHPWDELDERVRGRLFAAAIASEDDAPLLHQARKGRLDLEHLRKRFAGPADALRRLGG